MTSTNRKYSNYGFMYFKRKLENAYQLKARNQGNTVAATNPVFDLDYKAIVKSFLYCR